MSTGEWIGGICAVLALPTWKYVVPFLRDIAHFLEDWRGEDERPGVPGRLGVMARMAVLEENGAVIRHEVTPNSGGSLKDIAVTTRQELRDHISQSQLDRERLVQGGFLPPLS